MSNKIIFMDNSWETIEELKAALIKAGEGLPPKKRVEIERKWTVKNGPDIIREFRNHAAFEMEDFRIKNIVTTYVSTDPEIRIRANYNEFEEFLSYQVAYKGPADEAGLERIELEFETTKEIYHRLLRIAAWPVNDFEGSVAIQRTVWLAFYKNGLTYELKSADHGNDWQLEIEFENRESANNFEFPDYLKDLIGEDVTSNPRYKIKEYWKKTRPQVRFKTTEG